MAKSTVYVPRLKTLYKDQITKELQSELELTNIHQVPKLEKIIVSVGTGKKKDDKRFQELVKTTLTKITGQAPVERLAKKINRNLQNSCKHGRSSRHNSYSTW